MSAGSLKAALDEGFEVLSRRTLAPIEVAVLDSGIDASHPDLVGRIARAFAVEVVDGKAEVKEVEVGINNDAYGHGTGVASIIARIAPNARIIDVRVLGAANSGAAAATLAGLRLALTHRWKVVNLSLALAGSSITELQALCERAYYQDQILVAARRNMPISDDGFPAELSSCIGVDNEEFEDPLRFRYQSSDKIEFIAHGEEVTVAAPGGGYTTVVGTSFATPAISGICAVIVGAFNDLSPFEVKSFLKTISDA